MILLNGVERARKRRVSTKQNETSQIYTQESSKKLMENVYYKKLHILHELGWTETN